MKLTKIFIFVALLIGLVFFQNEVINPVLFDVAKSDLFLDDTENLGQMDAITTPLTDIAFMHCNTYIREKLDQEVSITFQSKALNAWDIGGHQYVINGEIETTTNNSVPAFTKYVCRIHYSEGEDENENENETMKYENWDIYGISGIEEL